MRYLLVILSFFFCLISPTAQSSTDSLPSDQIQILKRFRGQLEHTKKIKFTPGELKIDTTRKKVGYDIPIKEIEPPFEEARIEYQELRTNSLFEPSNFYSKLGYGTLGQPLIEASYGNSTPKNNFWNSSVMHHSVFNSDNRQDRSSTTVTFDGGFVLNDDWMMDGGVSYDQYQQDYQPVLEDSLANQIDEFRKVTSFTPNIRLDGYMGNTGLSAQIQYDYHDMNVDLSSQALQTQVEAIIDISDRKQLMFSLNGQLGENHTLVSSNSINYVEFTGSYAYLSQRWSLNAGLAVNKSTEVAFLPEVELSYSPYKDHHVTAIAIGGQRPLSVVDIINRNLFIRDDQEIDIQSKHYTYGIRYRNKIGALNMRLEALLKDFDRGIFFLRTKDRPHEFDLLLDDGNQTDLSLQIKYNLHEDLDLLAQLRYTHYNLDSLEAAWHIPNVRLNLASTVRLLDSRSVSKIELEYAGSAAFDRENPSSHLDPVINLSFTSKYLIDQHWSVFLDLDNLLNRQNIRFEGYTDLGFNAMIGVLIKY